MFVNVLDVDECANGYAGCQHNKCSNSDGSFVCSCYAGYDLKTDGKRCAGVK